jgi:hypothetical protein
LRDSRSREDILEIRDDDGKKWVDPDPEMRKNLNFAALKNVGLKVQTDNTISLL